MNHLSTLTEAIDILKDFSGDYSELRLSIIEYAEKARDSAEELSQVLDDLCLALEELPE